jgi:hypothetical protein
MYYKKNIAGEGRAVAKWLNDNAGTRSGKSVSQLVRSLKKLVPRLSFSAWWSENVTHQKSRSQNAAELTALNRELRKYQTFPMLLSYSSDVTMRRKGILESQGKFQWRWSRGAQPATPVVHSIVKLGEQGLITRLSECAKCKTWFYGVTNQIFCSSRCREKNFRGSQAWRVSRRLYMRRYRERERDRDDAT